MKFYFCESCGKRITEKDIDSGEGKNKKLKGVFCTACAVDVMTMETLPLTDQDAQKILRAEEEKRGGAATRRASRLQSRSASRIDPARRAGRRQASSQVRRGDPSNPLEDQDQKPGIDHRIYIGGIIGLILLLVGAYFMLGSEKSNPETQTRRSRRTTSDKKLKTAVSQNDAPAGPKEKGTSPPIPSPKYQPKNETSVMGDLRESLAAKKLKEAQEFYKTHPKDPWSYHDKLKALIRTYGTTKAGAEAAQLVKQLKLPERPQSAVQDTSAASGNPVDVKGAGEWKSLFDGSSKNAFAQNGPNWNLLNGVLEKNNRSEALMTRKVFEDDEVRIRFRVGHSNFFAFYFRHSGSGRYGYVQGNSKEIQKLKGRTVEFIFRGYGEQLEGFLEGKQVELKKIKNPSTKGQLQIRGRGAGLGIVSIDYRIVVPAASSK